MATFAPTYLKDMIAWINNPSIPMYIRRDHIAALEGGVDLTSPPGTPVYALADGPLLGAGNFGKIGGFSYSKNDDYGVVTQRVNIPGYGLNDLYYQHIIIDPSIKFCNNPTGSCNNQFIHKGQQIGVTGGFGENELGLNAQWGGVWGTGHPAPWSLDPRPQIKALMTNYGSTSGVGTGGIGGAAGPPSGSVLSFSVPTPPVAGTPFFTGIFQKIGLILVALTLTIVGFYLLFSKQINSFTKKAVETGIKAAEVAA